MCFYVEKGNGLNKDENITVDSENKNVAMMTKGDVKLYFLEFMIRCLIDDKKPIVT